MKLKTVCFPICIIHINVIENTNLHMMFFETLMHSLQFYSFLLIKKRLLILYCVSTIHLFTLVKIMCNYGYVHH